MEIILQQLISKPIFLHYCLKIQILDINVFLDFGNIWGVDYDSSIDDSNKIRSSTGIVANYNSPIGPMSFVFSQNISKQAPIRQKVLLSA